MSAALGGDQPATTHTRVKLIDRYLFIHADNRAPHHRQGPAGQCPAWLTEIFFGASLDFSPGRADPVYWSA